MQASLEAESKGKAEAMRVKKKLESDINELEIALDQANRGKAEMEKTVKKLQQQCRVSIIATCSQPLGLGFQSPMLFCLMLIQSFVVH